MDAMDAYDRAAIEALLTAVCYPLELEESVYDGAGHLLYQGPPGECAAVVGVESIHTDFILYDREAFRVAEISVVHELGDDYDPAEALDDARALAVFFERAPEYIEALLKGEQPHVPQVSLPRCRPRPQ